MQTGIMIAQWLLRVCGVIALLLGLLFWTNDALSLVPLHMLLGVLVVLSLWALALLGRGAGLPIGMVVGALIWGLVTLWLGFAQGDLVQSAAHWVIQAIHLLLGMGAVGLGEMLGGRLRRLRLAVA